MKIQRWRHFGGTHCKVTISCNFLVSNLYTYLLVLQHLLGDTCFYLHQLYVFIYLFLFQANETLRKVYDQKRKFLRELESSGETSRRIDKTRAIVKDLHWRIGVAIHRIDSISRRIEDLRDKELHPQLEELIEGYVAL